MRRVRLRRVLHRLVVAAATLVMLFAVLGLVVPRVVPRLAVFPQPSGYAHCSKDSGWETVTFRRAGLFWGKDGVSDLMICTGRQPG